MQPKARMRRCSQTSFGCERNILIYIAVFLSFPHRNRTAAFECNFDAPDREGHARVRENTPADSRFLVRRVLLLCLVIR